MSAFRTLISGLVPSGADLSLRVRTLLELLVTLLVTLLAVGLAVGYQVLGRWARRAGWVD